MMTAMPATMNNNGSNAPHYQYSTIERDEGKSLSGEAAALPTALMDTSTSPVSGNNDQEEKVCRICLEEDDPSTMIAPCKCKGSSKWVHRACLNMWRVNEKDRAFSQCTECLFAYRFESHPDDDARWIKARFCFFVSRDICFVTLALQLIISLLGWTVMLFDTDGVLLDLFCGGCSVCDDFWCHHKLAVYYTCGLFSLFILLGCFGSIVLCINGCKIPNMTEEHVHDRSIPEGTSDEAVVLVEHRANYYRQHRRSQVRGECCDGCCDTWCFPRGYYYHNHPYYHPYCYISSGGDDCCSCCYGSGTHCVPSHHGGGGDGNSGGTHIILAILLVVVVILAVIGFFVGIFLAVVIGQRILQRHVFRLQKRQLAEEFQVVDLSAYDLSQATQEAAASSIYDAIPVPPPAASTLSLNDASHLKKLGLLE